MLYLESLLNEGLELSNNFLELRFNFRLEVRRGLVQVGALDFVATLADDFAEVGLATTIPGEH